MSKQCRTLACASRHLSRLGTLTPLMLIVALAVWVGGSLPATATARSAGLTVEVTALDPGVTAIAVGDRFTIAFTVEDSTADTNNGTGAGTFPGLLTSFTMTADPGNAGTWTPSGTFDLGAASNFVTGAFGDNMAFQLRGTGFPNGGAGLTFWDITLGFSWPTDMIDSGLGDRFAQQLAPGTFGVPPATLMDGSGIRFDLPGVGIQMATFKDLHQEGVPTTSLFGLALLVLAVGALAWYRLH